MSNPARYLERAQTFIDETRPDALRSVLIPKLKRHQVPDEKLSLVGEEGSWASSLPVLADVLRDAGLTEVQVALEYNPYQMGNQRADVVLIGSKDGRPTVVVIELKQWSQARWDPVEERCTGFSARYPQSRHPARQARDYARFIEAYTAGFHADQATVVSVAYLHNATESSIQELRGAGQLEADTTFSGDSVGRARFVEFLRSVLDNVDGRTVALRLRDAQLENSPGVLEDAAGILSDPDAFPLTPQQEHVVHVIQKMLNEVRSPLSARDQAVIVVKGGPGTGKTWICLHLLAAESRAGHQCEYVTNSTALRASLQRHVRSVRSQFPVEGMISSGRMHWRQETWGTRDLMIVDEAQRLTEYTVRTAQNNSRKVQAELEANKVTQLFELKKTAKVLVLMIDEGQMTTGKDFVTIADAKALAERMGAEFIEMALDETHRSGGSGRYEEWVEALLAGRPIDWHDDSNFTVEVADSPEDLERRIAAPQTPDSKARLVAGFAWPWQPWPKEARSIDDVPFDIVIGDWRKRWNLHHRIDGYPDSDGWASHPSGAEQVGSLFSAQGFEFPHVGVLFGKDFTVDSAGRLGARSDASENKVLASRAKRDDRVDPAERIINQYRVLLTRAMKSVVLYSVDPGLQNVLRRHVNPPSSAAV